MDVGAAIRSSSFLLDEGDEWEPLTKTVCRRMAEHGIDMTGEEVRKLARKVKIPTSKIDGRIMAREADITKFVTALRKHFVGKM